MPVTVVGRGDRLYHIGASFRDSRPGPEETLVDTFLENSIIKVPRGCKATIFREPRVATGFPDLVIVIWHVPTTRLWHPLRAKLTNDDIRLMHYIVSASPTCDELNSLFPKKVVRGLDRLRAAEMIRQVRNRWTAKPLSKSFAARHIIAIEAKVNKWREALDQAHQNTWFASASYIMLSQIPKISKLQSQAQSLGIGIQALEKPTFDYRKVQSQHLPLSYASWLFNEWAWRATLAPEEGSPHNAISDRLELAQESVS